jgi:hypothetical protein
MVQVPLVLLELSNQLSRVWLDFCRRIQCVWLGAERTGLPYTLELVAVGSAWLRLLALDRELTHLLEAGATLRVFQGPASLRLDELNGWGESVDLCRHLDARLLGLDELHA